MPFDISALSQLSWTFIWVLARLSGFFLTAPFWSHKRIPLQIRIGLIVVLGAFLTPIVGGMEFVRPGDMVQLTAFALSELMVGAIIGFSYMLLFHGIRIGGTVIGMQMGFAIVNVIDPNSAESVSLIGELKFLFAMLVLLAVGGHRVMLRAVVDSYAIVPLAQAQWQGSTIELVMRLSGMAFVVGAKLAAPMMITLFITDAALGVLARTVPQMNVFIVGFPLKIGIGLLMIVVALPLFVTVFSKLLGRFDLETARIVRSLATGA